jgi:hypothetical protein
MTMADLPVATGQPGPSEEVYLDAARAYMRAVEATPPIEDEVVERVAAWSAENDGSIRAAVDSAFAAGWRARDAEDPEDDDDYELDLGTEGDDHPERPHDWYRPMTSRGPSRQQRCRACEIWETVVTRARPCPGEVPNA